MSYLEELLPEFRKGAKIRCKYWAPYIFIQNIDDESIKAQCEEHGRMVKFFERL